MELTLSLLTLLLATFTVSLAQQQPQQSAPLPPQRSSDLGVRYSAATDVSHISFSSPLVTYGSSLNEIRLPAAPIQPATLKQGPQAESERNEGAPQQGQTLVRSFGNQGQEQQLQANQPQFISAQQNPAQPQVQSSPQSFSQPQQPITRYAPAIQNQQPQFALAQAQPQPQQYVAPQPQYSFPQAPQPQQYALPQPQQYAAPQPQYSLPQAPQPQQYALPQPQQYVAPQQQYPSPAAYSSPASTGYFATGPFAAQYPQPSLVARQVAAQPQYTQASVPTQYPQAVAPAAQLVSRVAFNGAAGGFSYGF